MFICLEIFPHIQLQKIVSCVYIIEQLFYIHRNRGYNYDLHRYGKSRFDDFNGNIYIFSFIRIIKKSKRNKVCLKRDYSVTKNACKGNSIKKSMKWEERLEK